MGVSVLATLCMGVTLSVPILAGLLALNGLAQATGWSGNVGTMAAWFHRRERGAVMGAWATNFTVGSLSSAWVLAWVLAQRDEGAPPPWRHTMLAGAAVLAAVWVVFWFFQRNRPEDVGLSPVEDPDATALDTPDPHADETIVPRSAPRAFWTTLALIGGFYFFAKLVRYAIWSWAAFFLERNYQLSGAEANVYATTFDLMGIPGVWVTGWLSDRYFGSRRGVVAFGMMLGMTAACGALMLLGHTGVYVFAALLGVVGFTLYGPDALLTGAGAIDAGDRRTATFAAATISGLGSLGPIVQELVIGRLYDTRGGDLAPIFALLFGSAACAAAFCAALAWRERDAATGHG
jgi:OPA family glycerol-3-phosphate transporter-like MFS transporter